MALTLQNLNNIRTLRALARELSMDVLEEVLEKFRIVTEEKRSEQAELERQRAEQQDKINALLELMKADGISPSDLLGSDLAQAGQPTKNVKRVRRNIVLLTRTVKKKPGPVRDVRQSQLRPHWQTVNRWTIS